MKEGDIAPDFSLTDKDGNSYSLSSFTEPYLVIFFYPKDNTPGCTIEAKSFSDALEAFSSLGAAIIGISGGTDKTKASFCKKHELRVTLLSDPDFSTAKSYAVFGPKKFMGRSYEGIFRQTFILGAPAQEGRRLVLKIFPEVSPTKHTPEVEAWISEVVGKVA
jgi:peroxiredoxin Q/BCP